ncbi:MAG: UDP-N-acetylmuramyl pentapeptide synthase [uncultured bacterium]|nr:MAG: UDP-N-acetylmuramyl pentapeptide synthase [uncultured bacterium]
MNLSLYLIIICIWVVIAILDYGEFCYVWQLKEYRLDRFRDFISTKQGKSFLKSYLVLGRFAMLVILGFVWMINAKFVLSLVAPILFFEILRIGHKLFKRQAKRPKKTIKAVMIIFASLFFEFFVWYYFPGPVGFFAIFALRFVVLTTMVFLLYLPTKMIKLLLVFLAAKKIKKFPKLKVIGITGSYGKTTVKTFLDQILREKFKVITTPKNINTEIGVAKFILSSNFSGKEIFIVEMGAYNMGEIKMICDMVRPEIGILTAINEQHLSLFGSIENIQKAKYELLLSLPENGLAITNADNKYCMELLSSIGSQKVTCGSEEGNKPDCLIENVGLKNNGDLQFSLEINKKEFPMEAPVIGKHNAFNVAVSVMAAHYLGMSMKEISQQVQKLELPEGTLRLHKYGHSVIIDDSYNSNPDGFKSALEILQAYPSDFRKIVITRGMIELGEKSSERHIEIGKMISEVADELVIIVGNNAEELKSGAKDSTLEILSIYDSEKLFEYVQKFKNSACAVLLENRIPSNVHAQLTKSLQ